MAAGEGLTVVDAAGRSIRFAAPPQRIVVAGKATLPLANTLYLFPEAGERIVAISSGNQNPGDFLALVDGSFDEKTLLAPDAGPEQIAPLEPDVVLMRSFLAEKAGRALEQLEVPVVYLDLETPEQYLRDLETIGQLLDNQVRAEEIEAFYRARMGVIEEALVGLDDAQKPRILILQYTDQGGEVALNVPSVSWLQTTEAELAGAIPVWAEAAQGGGWTVVNFEQIAAWDPDQIFVISYRGDVDGIAASLRADPQWQALTAVKEDQLFGFAGDIYSWDQPDPRWILATTWLASRVHPERFGELDILQEVSAFFGELYGMDDAAIQEQIMPLLSGDVQ
jgi:iron complex transport system substrate-binding protein